MQSWYLLYCKHGQTQRAKRNLELQGVRCQAPILRLETVVDGQFRSSDTLLFPDYLFVQFDLEKIHTSTISSTRGVSHFIRFGGLPVQVPSDIIRQFCFRVHIRRICCTDDAGDNSQRVAEHDASPMAILNEPDGHVRSLLMLSLLEKQLK